MKALVQALKPINDEIYAGHLPISSGGNVNGGNLPGGAPCQPSAPPPFTGQVLFERLRKVRNILIHIYWHIVWAITNRKTVNIKLTLSLF